jgi:hypothetical protein
MSCEGRGRVLAAAVLELGRARDLTGARGLESR